MIKKNNKPNVLVFYPTDKQRERMKKVSFKIVDLFEENNLSRGEICAIITCFMSSYGIKKAVLMGGRE